VESRRQTSGARVDSNVVAAETDLGATLRDTSDRFRPVTGTAAAFDAAAEWHQRWLRSAPARQ
jgi:hypothetical protein